MGVETRGVVVVDEAPGMAGGTGPEGVVMGGVGGVGARGFFVPVEVIVVVEAGGSCRA